MKKPNCYLYKRFTYIDYVMVIRQRRNYIDPKKLLGVYCTVMMYPTSVVPHVLTNNDKMFKTDL